MMPAFHCSLFYVWQPVTMEKEQPHFQITFNFNFTYHKSNMVSKVLQINMAQDMGQDMTQQKQPLFLIEERNIFTFYGKAIIFSE